MKDRDSIIPTSDSQSQGSEHAGMQMFDPNNEHSAHVADAIANFAAGISHELNNAIAIIMGYAEELREDLPADSPLGNHTKEILKAGDRARELSNKLSIISQKTPPELVSIDLNDSITKLMHTMKSIMGAKIDVVYEPERSLKPILANQECLKQLILNLASYARSAMPSGGTLSITTGKPQDGSRAGCIQLTVTDSSKPIDPHKLSRIFEPYVDALSSEIDTRMYLALVYSIMKQLKGSIAVEPKATQGLTFKMYFPIAKDKIVTSGTESTQPEITECSNELILVVDDEPQICTISQRMIEAMGCRCVAFSNSNVALEAIKDGLVPDLVISDLVMPGIDGIELVTRIKNLLPKIGVILISGFTDRLMDRARSLGYTYPLLSKPFTQAQLSHCIREALQKKRTRTAITASIFILDDDENIRILLGRACNKRGHHLMGAESLEEALEILAHHSFDILLIDQSLQDTNGIAALREIRKMGVDTPALIFTGAVVNDYTEIMAELNVIKVMEKTFDNNPLLDYIEEALSTF